LPRRGGTITNLSAQLFFGLDRSVTADMHYLDIPVKQYTTNQQTSMAVSGVLFATEQGHSIIANAREQAVKAAFECF
jgi:hypothetical protein